MEAFVAAIAPSLVAIAAVTTPSLTALADRFSRSADNTWPMDVGLCEFPLPALPADQANAMRRHVHNHPQETNRLVKIVRDGKDTTDRLISINTLLESKIVQMPNVLNHRCTLWH